MVARGVGPFRARVPSYPRPADHAAGVVAQGRGNQHCVFSPSWGENGPVGRSVRRNRQVSFLVPPLFSVVAFLFEEEMGGLGGEAWQEL